MMNIEEICDYAKEISGSDPEFPFGEDNLVYKIKGKIFLIVSLQDEPQRLSLKGLPEHNIELREKYPLQVTGGYHLNKKHWNTISLQGLMPMKELNELIRKSYLLAGKFKI